MNRRSGVSALARGLSALLLAAALPASPALGAEPGRPSRPPVKGCVWEKASDAGIGLEAWVQRCDFGFRKIDFLFDKGSLAIRYSDGSGKPDPLVEILDLAAGETWEKGIQRLFAERTPKAVAARCALVPFHGGNGKAPAGVKRFTFMPDSAYQKELAAKASPNEVPEPPCGDWGAAPDGIQYFEAHPGGAVRKVLFVRVGQDEPLFDEKTLTLLPARP